MSKKFRITEEQLKTLIVQSYSGGWHDGQDAIIMRIKHIDKGGDELGEQWYSTMVISDLEELNLL
jgi:hypothetical protein